MVNMGLSKGWKAFWINQTPPFLVGILTGQGQQTSCGLLFTEFTLSKPVLFANIYPTEIISTFSVVLW